MSTYTRLRQAAYVAKVLFFHIDPLRPQKHKIGSKLKAQIQLALNQPYEWPWYAIYGQIAQRGPLAVKPVAKNKRKTWHVVNYQVRLVVRPNDDNDHIFVDTTIPDVVQSVLQQRSGLPGPSMARISLIIENKCNPPANILDGPIDEYLGPVVSPAWVQIA